MYRLADYDFHLPRELIARFPAARREDARLMIIDRGRATVRLAYFSEFPDLVPDDSFLVMNRTRVLPARLFGRIGGRVVEMLVVAWKDERCAEVLALPAAHFRLNAKIDISSAVSAEVEGMGLRGRRWLRFSAERCLVQELGYAPLPPYIKRRGDEARTFRDFDLERYQTVYARDPGSIAAPTAGLHFSPAILAAVAAKCSLLEVTLQVGEATFQKIAVDDIRSHRLGTERVTIAAAQRAEIERLKAQGKKLLAVGTTSVRALESLAALQPAAESFATDLFIYPGFSFRLVDRLLTNFHLPQSSLFILVCAFAGIELMQRAYAIAVENRFRFFSYGDAMLIL